MKPGREPAKERFYRWLAWKLPHRLAYWTYVRVATNQPTFTSEQSVLDALRAWQDAQVKPWAPKR